MHIYQSAWEKGLKTTYYLHMKPRHNAEQSTVKVNKSEALGRRGFAALRMKGREDAEVVESVPSIQTPQVSQVEKAQVSTTAPILSHTMSQPIKSTEKVEALKVHLPDDPQDQFLCEGCQ